MNDDVERFFEECRAERFFQNNPDVFEDMIETFEKLYREADESPAWQDFWDLVREIVTRKEPLIERFKALAPLWQNTFDL
jgi:hypothetical protein